MSFNGDLYPSAGASVVMTTSGDMVKYQSGARTRLGIGSANQILQVKSSLPSWETVDLADTVLTVAGDVLYENATPELARLPKGTQYNNLQMGSALPEWASSSTSIMTGTGDLLYSSGANTLARLTAGTQYHNLQQGATVPSWASSATSTLTGAMDILYSSSANTLARLSAGTDGDVLTTHGTSTNLTWETPAAGGATVTVSRSELTADATSTSSSFVDTGLTLTTQTSGNFLLTSQLIIGIDAADTCRFQLGTFTNGGVTEISMIKSLGSTDNLYQSQSLIAAGTSSGQGIKVQMRNSAGSATITLAGENGGSALGSAIVMFEVA